MGSKWRWRGSRQALHGFGPPLSAAGTRPGNRRQARDGLIFIRRVCGALPPFFDTTWRLGEIELLQAMPEDHGEKRFRSAATKLKKHWEAGEIPKAIQFACG